MMARPGQSPWPLQRNGSGKNSPPISGGYGAAGHPPRTPILARKRRPGLQSAAFLVTGLQLQTYDFQKSNAIGECAPAPRYCLRPGFAGRCSNKAPKVCANQPGHARFTVRYEGSVTSTKLKLPHRSCSRAGEFMGDWTTAKVITLSEPYSRRVQKKLGSRKQLLVGACLYGTPQTAGFGSFRMVQGKPETFNEIRDHLMFGEICHRRYRGHQGPEARPPINA